jgi:hypothetical protein
MALVVTGLITERLTGHVAGRDALRVRGVAQTFEFGFERAFVDFGFGGGAGGAGSNEAISQRW